MRTYLYVHPETKKAVPITRFFDMPGMLREIDTLARGAQGARIKLFSKINAWQKLRKYYRPQFAPPGLSFERFLQTLQGMTDHSYGRGKGDGTFTYKTLLVAGMHFMDAYNYDINRVMRCVIHYSAPDGKVYPFCPYNSGPCYREKIEKQFSVPFDLKAAKAKPSNGNGHGNSGNNGNGASNSDSGDASVDTSNLPGNSEKGLENALASGRGHKYGIYKHLAKEGDTVSNGEIVSNSGTGSSTPAGFTTGANGQSSFLYYYHPDHLGSTGFVTDANGKLYEHMEYFPFGETWVDEHSNTLRTPYLFTGKEYDIETGLYYFGARYYDPRTSVWQSPDPILGSYLEVPSVVRLPRGGRHATSFCC